MKNFVICWAISLFACSNVPPSISPEPASPGGATPVTRELPKPTSEAESLLCAEQDNFCIGFLTDGGQIDDGSFYQSAWNGVRRAEADLAATVSFVETRSADEYVQNIELFADQKYDLVVTAGYDLLLPTIEAAKKYPDITFVGIDQDQYIVSNNVAGVVFPEEKAGFLAGVLAATVTQSDTIGVVLSTFRSPVYRGYREGFKAGVEAVDPQIKVIVLYHPEETLEALNDAEWGAKTARFMIGNGADVIFAAGGETAKGALIEAANSESVRCIGADVDQYEFVPEARPCLVSSALRNIEHEVFAVIAQSALGRLPNGNIEGRFQLAPFRKFDVYFPADVNLFFKNLEAGLLNGSIPTDGSYRVFKPPEIIIP